jgi:hypothetical protein
MKKIFFGLVLFFLTNEVFAQEKPILTNCSTDTSSQNTKCHAVIKYPTETFEGELITSNCKEDEKKNLICFASFKASNNSINYEGQIVNGLPSGKAVIKYGNGNRFEGNVEEYGLKLNGKYFYKNGDIWNGIIKDQKFYGQGTYLFNNGNTFVGDLNGQGISYGKGLAIKGNYKNGKVINAIILKDRDIVGIYLDGKLTSLLISEKEKFELEKKYEKYCSESFANKNIQRDTAQYYKCLADRAQLDTEKIALENNKKEKLELEKKQKEQLALKAKEKLELEKKEKEQLALKAKEKLELEKKQKEQLALKAKEKLELEKKQKEEQKNLELLAKMTPDEQRAYTCNKIYGFSTWGNSYKECVIKLIAADNEKSKLQEQKRLAAEQAAQRQRIAEAEAAQRQRIAEAEAAQRQRIAEARAIEVAEAQRRIQLALEAEQERRERQAIADMFNAIANYQSPVQRMQQQQQQNYNIQMNCRSYTFGRNTNTTCE